MPEITLSDMLDAKEARVTRRMLIQADYPGVCLSLSINIPGVEKDSHRIRTLFKYAVSRINESYAVITSNEVYEKTGPHALFIVTENAVIAKKIACQLETEHDYSRLLDLDVYDVSGCAVASPNRKSGRNCFLCSNLAIVCMRERHHSLPEILAGVDLLFKSFYRKIGKDCSG